MRYVSFASYSEELTLQSTIEHLFQCSDSGAFGLVAVELFPAQFSRRRCCAAARPIQAAALLSSSAGCSDGSTDDEGSPSEVSVSSRLSGFQRREEIISVLLLPADQRTNREQTLRSPAWSVFWWES